MKTTEQQGELIAPENMDLVITDSKILRVIQRLNGLFQGKEAIEKIKISMPGIKMALQAVEAEVAKEHQWLMARLVRDAAARGVDLSRHCVVGVTLKDDKYKIGLQTYEELEGER